MTPRQSAWLDTAIVIAATLGPHAAIRAIGGSVAAGSLATIAIAALCLYLLKRRAIPWAAIGLARPSHLGKAVAWALGLFVADMLIVPVLAKAIADSLQFPAQDLSAFAGLRGNTLQYLVLLIPVGWGAAAIGEELIYRGFINRRLTDALGAGSGASAVALLVQSALFAGGHFYLGPRGMLNAGVLALLAGVAFLWNGRNLWPLVIAHGLVDSIGLTMLYLGAGHG